jgi:hypothetical protein
MIGITTYFRIGIVIAIGLAIASCFWYYNWSQNKLQELRENNTKLTLAVEQNEATIRVLNESIVRSNEQINTVNTKFQDLRQEHDKLSKKFSKHDIGYLASKKPKLVQKIFNKGTADVGRCFELATGATLTDKELDATKPSQINGSCPDLANPNFMRKP